MSIVLSGIVKYVVDRFIVGVKGCKTVDCVLVKLSTAVYDIRSYTSSGGYTTSTLIHEFLQNSEVMKILSGLSYEKEYVEMKISTDPRFSSLKPYLQLIISAIDSAEERGIEPSTIFRADTRGPTWQIEYQEEYGRTHYKRIYVKSRKKRGIRGAIEKIRELFITYKKTVILLVLAATVVAIAVAIAILLSRAKAI